MITPAFVMAQFTVDDAHVQTFLTQAVGIGQALWNHGNTVAKSLTSFAIIMRVSFAGFGIMMGHGAKNFTSQFLDILIKAAIVYILVYNAGPQMALEDALTKMRVAGQTVANDIFTQTGITGAAGQEPPTYWIHWIAPFTAGTGGQAGLGSFNIGPAITVPNGGSFPNQDIGNLKFNYSYILNDILGWDGTSDMVGYIVMIVAIAVLTIVALVLAAIMVLGTGTGDLGEAMATLLGMALFGFISALIVAGSIAYTSAISSCLLALFSFVGGLVAPYVMFYVILGLGVMIIPLIFFKRYEHVWVHYLTYLTGCVLAVFLYYICAAIGFVITNYINVIFFAGAYDPAAASGFKGLVGEFLGTPQYQNDFLDMIPIVGTLQQIFSNRMSGGASFGQVLLLPTAWTACCAIMVMLIAGGISVGAMGTSLAFKWTEAFSSPEAMQVIQKVFDRVGASVQTGAGAGATQAAGMADSAFKQGSGLGMQGGYKGTQWGADKRRASRGGSLFGKKNQS